MNLVVPGAVIAGGLGLALFLALYLFCTLKAEMRAAGGTSITVGGAPTRPVLEHSPAQPACQETEFAELAPAELMPVQIRPGMNLSRRSHALRMARRGDSPEQIAARLGLPAQEVRLLLKIHRKLVHQAVAGPARTPFLNSVAESDDISSSTPQDQARTVSFK